jgi:hypothetical protein
MHDEFAFIYDTKVVAGTVYLYRVIAVDKYGHEA